MSKTNKLVFDINVGLDYMKKINEKQKGESLKQYRCKPTLITLAKQNERE